MLDLFSSVANTLVSLVGFIANSVTSLIDLLARIPTYIAYLTSAIGFTPTLVQPFLLASISIYVVFLIIDR